MVSRAGSPAHLSTALFRVRCPPGPCVDPWGSATGIWRWHRAPTSALGTFASHPLDFAVLPRAGCPGQAEEESLARRGQRQTGARRTAPQNPQKQNATRQNPQRQNAQKQRRARNREDVISVLARVAREVEEAARRGRVTATVRTKFQAVALLLRDERARAREAS